ncbi:MAG TPA: hypothetical protein EYN64_02390 [Flavobacteriales bacterium]|nr:hypothetical protein [Flavobacteriales bacterium]
MDYGELKTAIQDYCQNSESSFVSNLPNFVRFAENTIFSAIDLPSKWKSILDLSLSDGTSEYDLGAGGVGTAGAFDILSVRVSPVTSQTNGVDYGPVDYLLQKDYDFLLEAYPGTLSVVTKGAPKYYAISSTGVSTSEPTLTIRFGPIPDAAYQATVTYYGKTSSDSITSGADSVETWLSVSFPEVLLYGSLVQAYTYMKGEPDMIQMYEKQFLDGMTLLKNMTETRMDSSSFRPAASQG